VITATSFVGASGAAYSFADIDQSWLLPRTAGAFIYVRRDGAAQIVLYVGVCDDLLLEARDRWSAAVSLHGATNLLVRRNVTSRVRLTEQIDLIRAYEPIMNAQQAPMPFAAQTTDAFAPSRSG
jgi:hypothetical protein